MTAKPLILVTNDDGIESPGLMAAIGAVLPLGEVMVAAPHFQQTGAGRSYAPLPDRRIYRHSLQVDGDTVPAYSIKGRPAQVTIVALLDLTPRPPDLVVSGINFGANVGNGITISGTVGAALEAASEGIPTLAVSLETPVAYHVSHSNDIDFSTAAYFTRLFATAILQNGPLPFDVDILKIDVPPTATPETPWRWTRVSRHKYNQSLPTPPEERGHWVQPGYEPRVDTAILEPDSDIWALAVDQVVSVSPVSIDLTARVVLTDLSQHLKIANSDAI